MKKLTFTLLTCLLSAGGFAGDSNPPAPASTAALSLREIVYDGRLSDDEARFTADVDVEAAGRGESSTDLFEGDVAVLPSKLPDALKIVRDGNRYSLVAVRPGRFRFKLELATKIQRAEPWNQICFTGPAAAIASVVAQSGGAGMEVQLLSGTLLEATRTGGVSRVKGFLGADRTVAVRWSHLRGTAEVARKTLLTVDSAISALITPAVIKYTSQFHYEILQGNAAQLTLVLPAAQALTRLTGEQIRDWHTTADGDRQILTVEFIKPVEKSCDLTLYSEQGVEVAAQGGTGASLKPPQPLEAERESGSLTFSAEDTLVEIESLNGLRQVNAADKALAAYRFNARPFSLVLKLKRIEPVISVADRVSVRLEETRLLVSHALMIEVKKAGIYVVELTPQSGFAVADVRGDGIEDWNLSRGPEAGRKVLRVNFSARVLGMRRLDVQLEQALKNFPGRIGVAPLRVIGAAKETAQIGAASAPGIQLKTAELTGLREIPMRTLQSGSGFRPVSDSEKNEASRMPVPPDELLAYTADQPDWNLTIASERLAARIVADVFNLVTVGDGIVSGSATIRYGLVNQGVQEFKVKLPAQFKNIEFTGPNIRRKEQTGDVWTIGLQDKAWGGYTLVVTYDYPFDAKGATLPVGGVHALDAEHETGSVAVTTAASLQLNAKVVGDALRRVDEVELSALDRSLITRAVVLAYQYTGNQYDLAVDVNRYAEEPVLEAVADRTQITSVLNEAGEMLTQASFMVKNNEKQFQGFQLPGEATLWGCYVNGQPVKPERNAGQILVPLPRDTNRDQAFAVDIMYAETNGPLASRWVQSLELSAPRTDVPNTYAEWQLFVPPSVRLSDFGGSMNVARGTTYGMLDAWGKFLAFYGQVLREAGGAILVIGFLAVLVIALVISAVRRGWNGIVTLLAVAAILAVLGAMLLPALSSTKMKAQGIGSIDDLKPTGPPAEIASDSGPADYVDTHAGLPAATPPALPTAAGIRSIRIELPRTGQPFLFTKVLNVHDDPLSIHARLMSLRTFQTLQMAWQAAVFLLGLGIWFWQWRRVRRSSFVLTFALALILGSVGSLLIQWRALHDLLIIGFPVVTLAVIASLVWKNWPRASHEESSNPPAPRPPPVPSLTGPSLTAAIALLFALNPHGARAEESPIADRQSPIAAHPLPIINRPSRISDVSLVSAGYSGTVSDRVAVLDAVLQFSSAKAGQTVSLFDGDVAVRQFTVKNGEAKLVRDGNHIAVRLGNRGEVTLQIQLLVKVAGDVTKRSLAFGLPPALSSQVSLAIDEPEADVDFPTAISFKRVLIREQTRVEAVIGSGDRVEMLWTPRVKRAAEVTATVFCQSASLATFGGGVVNVSATLDYQVTQGELRQARVQLPAGQRLLRVEGASIRTWEIKNENGAQVLVVDLLKGIPLGWRLTIETEKTLDTLPVTAPVEVPHALDVKRETGLIALRCAEELGLSVEAASDLQRVDAEEFARDGFRRDEAPEASGTQSGVEKAEGLFSVFRFSKPGFALRVRAEAVQPQIEAIVRNSFRLGAEQVALSATIDYTIKRVGVFTLKAGLPDGYRVEAVNGGNVLQWNERTDTGSLRCVEVTLKERTSGVYALKLELVRNFKELPKSLALDGVHPLDAVKLTGFISVSAEPGLAVKTESFDGLVEIPVTSLPDTGLPVQREAAGSSLLAYKFISSEPKAAPEWKLNVTTETIEAWVRAEIVNTITLSDSLISGRSLVRYDIGNAPVKELWVKVPAEFKNVEITGPNIRSKGPENSSGSRSSTPGTNDVVWRVELQSKTRGFYTLTVTWELPRASKTSTIELAGVAAEGAERETGLLAIAARAPLQVTELQAAELQRVDTSDFPDWAGVPNEATVLAYRYVRPGCRLTVDARRYAGAEVLQALVDNARFTTVVADDGQFMTEMALSVRNNGRQFLEIELAPGATVWSAFVGGQPVRPSRRDGKLLLPIQQTGAGDGAVSVEMTYAGTYTFPHSHGSAEFVSPKFDVPLKNAHWELFLPPDYDYQDFRGTMNRELAAAQPSPVSFSLLDYSRMEKASKDLAEAEVKRDVSEAQRQLAGGNVREAAANFNRTKGKFSGNQGYVEGAKKLEQDLQSAQANNLINAQNDFSWRSGGQVVANENAPMPGQQPALLYDNEEAEKQWAKLQQAQEIVAANVQPLHVNLPLRGRRFAFTQVLQTEIRKPMTIRLLAASTHAVSWPGRVTTALAGFLVLWGISALTLRATRRQTA